MEGSVAAGVRARPWTLRVFVLFLVASTIYSFVVGDDSFSFANVFFSLVFLVLVKELWNGSRGAWWFFVIALGAMTAALLSQVADEPLALVGVAGSGGALLLLVLEPTQSFVRHQTDGRFP